MKKYLLVLSWLLLTTVLPHQMEAQKLSDLFIVAPFSLPTGVISGGTYSMGAHIGIKAPWDTRLQSVCIGYYLSSDRSWDANDTYLGLGCQSLLIPGQSGATSIMGTIPPTTPTGDYYLLLIVDPFNAEEESDETNNLMSFPINVFKGSIPPPDLTLQRPSLSFSTVPAGGITGAFAIIVNKGSNLVGPYEIGYYLSADTVFSANNDVFIGQFDDGGRSGVGILDPRWGISAFAPVLPIPKSTAPGNYYLLIVADPRNLVAESDETNNSRALRLTVTGSTVTATANDATNDAVQVYPNPVAQGTRIKLEIGAAAAELVEIALIDGLGRLVASKNIRTGQIEATFETTNLPAGLYTLRLTGPSQQVVRRVLIK